MALMPRERRRENVVIASLFASNGVHWRTCRRELDDVVWIVSVGKLVAGYIA
jgi:hypothetical protein